MSCVKHIKILHPCTFSFHKYFIFNVKYQSNKRLEKTAHIHYKFNRLKDDK